LLWRAEERKDEMSEKYYIEGHRSKASLEDENTLIIEPQEGFNTAEEAARKARQFFEQQGELGLTVIYREEETGEKEALMLIFRGEEGTLEEMPLFY
jgi:hypothetical protein